MDPLRLLDLHDPRADAPRAFRDGVAGLVGGRPELAPVAREALRGPARTAASPAGGEAAGAAASLMEGVIQAHTSLPWDFSAEGARAPGRAALRRPPAPGP